MKWVIVFCLIFSGCAKEIKGPPQLLEFVERFKTEALLRNVPADVQLTLEFADLDKPIAGIIVRPGNTLFGLCDHDSNLIQINQRTFPDLNKVAQEILLFHELGHCIYGLPHNTKGWSIMGDGSISQVRYYMSNRAEELDELFEDARGKI